MKRLLFILPALFLLFVMSSAGAYEKWLGTITSPDGGAFNNTTSCVTLIDAGTGSRAFTIGYGLKLAVQCDLASCVQSAGDAGFFVTCASGSTSHGIGVASGQWFPLSLSATDNVVAMKPLVPNPDAGAVNCDVFLLSK